MQMSVGGQFAQLSKSGTTPTCASWGGLASFTYFNSGFGRNSQQQSHKDTEKSPFVLTFASVTRKQGQGSILTEGEPLFFFFFSNFGSCIT